MKTIFSPLIAPHFGGLWERLVRSCKKAMWNNVWSQSLREEQLTTVICSVEKLLNNQLLTASNKDAAELEAFTPNHFLVGRYTLKYPNVLLNGGSAARKKGFWTQITSMKTIWAKWMNDVFTWNDNKNEMGDRR